MLATRNVGYRDRLGVATASQRRRDVTVAPPQLRRGVAAGRGVAAATRWRRRDAAVATHDVVDRISERPWSGAASGSNDLGASPFTASTSCLGGLGTKR